ncbi:MAG: oligosaccharide flippase family protein [Actinobacteria bacterium]|nr:oligosaccharide flippase family protein [Actinomycetota bacterium]
MSPPEVAAGVVEHPELAAGPTAHPELDVEEVKRRAIRGVGSMFVRSLGQRGVQMVGNILLARWLAPETIGLWAVVSMFVGFAGLISDLGLSASLIQRNETLDEDDLRTGFTLNLGFNVVSVAVIWILAAPLARAYHAPSAVTGIRMLALTIMLSTFTFVPGVQLERRLKFNRITLADLLAQLAYIAVAITLAIPYYLHPSLSTRNAHGAVWVFIWATVASKCVQMVIVNTAYRWKPRFGFNARAMRGMLAYGLPYQLNGIVNWLKDSFIPMFVALVAGASAAGYIVWAAGMATNALFLLPIVQRVAFPAFARLQHDTEALREAIEKAIKWVAATVIPTVFLLAALGRQIVEHVYGTKWFIGLPAFYLLCLPMINAAYSTVMVSALYGVGRAKKVLQLTMIWGAAGWALGVPLTFVFPQYGYPLALCIVSCLSYMSVREMNKVVRVTFIPQMVKIAVLAAIPSIPIALYCRFLVHNVFELAGVAVAGGVAYLVLMWLAGELDEIVEMMRNSRTRRVPLGVPEPAPVSGGQS